MIVRIIPFLISVALFTACTVYIDDPIDPRLPKYTESGKNTSGALINNDVWDSKYLHWDSGLMIESFPSLDSVVISIPGHIYDSTYVKISFAFHHHLTDVSGFYSLEDKEIILDGVSNQGVYSSYTKKYTGGVGKLFIRNIYKIDSLSCILSGTFGFTLPDTGMGPIEVGYGRFDYKIKDVFIFK